MSRIVNSVMSCMTIAFAGSGRTEASAPRAQATPRNRHSSACLWLLLALSAFAAPAFAQNTILVNKAFGTTTIVPGGTTTMTITLYNTDTVNPQTALAFTDTFPANLSWTSLVSNSCGGALSAPGTTLELLGGGLPAASPAGPSTCTIVVNVTSSTTGNRTNEIPDRAVTGTAGGSATTNATGAGATLTVSDLVPVSVTKAFQQNPVAAGVGGTFVIRVSNPNVYPISQVDLFDDLDSDVSSTPAGGSLTALNIVSSTCGGTPSIDSGNNRVVLDDGVIPAASGCEIVVAYQANQAGTYTNTLPIGRVTVGSVPGGAADNTSPATASVAVQNEFTVGKNFDVATIKVPDPFVLTLTFYNPGTNPINALGLTDVFPSAGGNSGIPDIVVSEVGPQIISNSCGGSVSAAGGASSVTISGGVVPPASVATGVGVCTLQIRVRGNEVLNSQTTNQIGTGTSGGAATGNNGTPISSTNLAEATVELTSDAGGGFGVGNLKTYLSDNVAPGTVVRARIVITNPNAIGATDINLTDVFQGLTSQGAVSDVVLAPTGGNFSLANCGEAGNPNFDNANGFPAGGPQPPDPNPNSDGKGFEVDFISLLPLSGNSAGGTAGWTNPACVIEFDVVGSVIGTHRNDLLTGSVNGGNLLGQPAGGGAVAGPSSASFTYVSSLAVAKQFNPYVVNAGGVSRLTISLSNSNPNASTSNLDFIDTLPNLGVGNQVQIAPVPNVANTCGGTVNAVPGGGTVELSNGTVQAQLGGVDGLCQVSVDVVAIADSGSADWNNVIGANAVTGNLDSAGNPQVTNLVAASAPLYARALDVVVSKSFSPASIDGGDTSDVTVVVRNPNPSNWTLGGVNLVDNLPAGMVVATPSVSSTTCTTDGMLGGTAASITAAAASNSFALNGATLFAAGGLPAGGMQECSVTVRVTTLVSGSLVNTIRAGDVTSANGASNSAPFSATLTVSPKTAVSKQFFPNTIPAGGISELEFRIVNANGVPATNISVTDVMPGAVLVAPGPVVISPVAGTTCPGLSVTATPGGNTIQANGLSLAAFQECRYRVQVTSDVPSGAAGYVNTILPNQVSSTEGGIRTEDATATLYVTNGPVVTKSFDRPQINLGETVRLTMRVTNPSAINDVLSNVDFVDNLPSGVQLAAPSNLAVSGACSAAQVTEQPGSITLSGATLPAAGFCEIQVDVLPQAVGTYTNVLPPCDLTNPNPVAGTSAAATAISGGSTPTCNVLGAQAEVEVVALNLGFTKTLSAENGAVAGIAEPGEQLTYTIAVTNNSSSDANAISVVDVVPANTTFVSADNGGVLNGGQVDWTINVPANSTVNIQVVFQVADPLPAGVTSVANSATVNGQTCATVPCVETPTQLPELVVTKTVTAESGTTAGIAEAGEQITYTINVANTTGVDAAGVSIVDVVPANTTFVSAGNGGVLNGNQVEWTQNVPANSSVQVTVTFAVSDPIPAGVTSIANNATANGQGCVTTPCVETPVATPEFTISKALTAENGVTAGVAEAGEQLTYTITVANTSNANAASVLVADLVPANTTFVSADSGGVLNGNQVQWTLPIPANTSVTLSVVFAVDDPLPDGVTSIANNATVEGQGCATTPCVETPVGRPELGFIKTLSAESGSYPGVVEPGEQLTYTVTVENTGNAAAVNVPVIDTLPAEVAFVSADNSGTFSSGLVNWTIASIVPGQSVLLTVVVRAPAVFPAGTTRIVNNATVDGEACTTQPCVETPVARPPTAIDDDGGVNQVGLAVTLATPGNDQPATAPLDPTSVWIVGTSGPNVSLRVPGEGTWSVNPTTGQITFTPEAGFSGNPTPIRYTIADTLGLRSNEAVETLEYTQDLLLRLSKKASVRTVVIGDLVQYTLTIENVGDIDVVDATVQDLPPNGFTFVPGSLRVLDKDNNGTLVSSAPLRIAEVDVDRGDTATITYLMAVGAGTLPGTHTNTAIVLSNEVPISNEASATVVSTADPLLEQSLIIGTVFNDRDSDAWQDSAKASGLRVSGGIDESVYVAGSTTVDFGQGPQAQADASAPLNHGLKLGTLEGRNTAAEAEDAHRIVISQRLREARFAEGFTLVTDEGSTVRMDAAGKVSTERSGDAAKGLTAQDLRVERKVTPVDGQFQVDYVISNAGIDERGIPGVRIGTVEGLLIETDGYGRFHLEGITPSHYARGSNFVMKIDAATLPRGSTYTTENPRVKRVTPGVLTRFDFGVKVPETVIEGGEKTLEMSLGEVVFEANSAVVRPQYAPVIEHMAGEVRKHGGGEVEIAGFGGTPELALARAKAVHEAMLAQLPADIGERMQVKVRGEVDGAEVLTYGNRISLGEVFFDTDKSTVKPAYASVIDKVAAEIEAGRVSELLITGHTDKRASDAYNLALGKRRAEAVYQAISRQLSPERRATLKVQYLPTSSADAPYEPARGQ